MSDVWNSSNGNAWQCYIFPAAYYMDGCDGDNGGKEYLEMIAKTLGVDVDNE
jgi:hypothetical protein